MSDSSVVPITLGCNPCGTRWNGGGPCWMCARPGVPVEAQRLGYIASSYLGEHTDRAAVAAAGPTLTDDPCGSGPL